MRCVKAVFKKQLKDFFKNLGVLIQFIIFPAVAFAMTELVALGDEYIPDTMFVTMLGVVASTLLGLTIGISANNAQAAGGLAMPFALIFAKKRLEGVNR